MSVIAKLSCRNHSTAGHESVCLRTQHAVAPACGRATAAVAGLGQRGAPASGAKVPGGQGGRGRVDGLAVVAQHQHLAAGVP
ncbi:hypothetical protein [Streptacidiphilus rugosus]|uniref:hypothetical protein n=1 Tax=Streptacidiphilus rugosus TaxID=405783 RepID=UPI000AE83905|nr:hypothetical protein [Streptacidiphilus rugosus]